MSRRIATAAFLSYLLLSCQHNTKNIKSHADTISSNTHANLSAFANPDSVNNYKLYHFWDNFDFKDEIKATSPAYGEQHFVDFIYLFGNSTPQQISQSIRILIEKTAVNKNVQQYFEDLFEKYLYNVNSPFYNEQRFVLALEQFIASKHVSLHSKNKYKVILQIANKNKVGEFAQDFSYLSNNKRQKLFDLHNDYIIVFFYDPECQHCQATIQEIASNQNFNNLLTKDITMLAIDSQGKRQKWEEFKNNIPNTWINGIDLEQNILRKGLYDLKASPTVYLLDSAKRVILKDEDILDVIRYLQDVTK